jgi:RNA polymerase sigma-70 factor (ECF subfamily)
MPSRVDDAGELTAFFEQDRSRWDSALIAEGRRLLAESACGDQLTTYHGD